MYMQQGDVPVVSGLYFTKSEPSEPLIYRGRGSGAYLDFRMGDKVYADGVPTGCLLIHHSHPESDVARLRAVRCQRARNPPYLRERCPFVG